MGGYGFQSSYADKQYLERLFGLYKKLSLYGFLLDESNRLMASEKSREYQQMVQKWYRIAKRALVNDEMQTD